MAHQKLKAQYTQQVASMLDNNGVSVAAAAQPEPKPEAAAAAAPPQAPAAPPAHNPYADFKAAPQNKHTQPYAEHAQNIRAAFKSLNSSGGMLGTMQKVVEAASNKQKRRRIY